MDFTLPKHLQLFKEMLKEFAETEVRPKAKKMDAEGWPDPDVVRKLGENGLLGIPFPTKYGGGGLGEMGYCLLMETMGGVCTSTATLIGAHIGIGVMALYLGGTEEQKKKYMPDLCNGRKIAAFCLTEPGAGSDAAGIKTRAIKDGNSWVITGNKIYITNGPIADVFTVLAVTDPALGARGGVTAFIVEKGMPGVSVGTVEHKMGIRGSATSEMIFDEVVVPSANVLGQVGAGFVTFMATLDTGRLGLGAACLGGAEAALESMCKYAAGRQQFGKPIAEKQAIQWMIADTASEVEALRSMVYRTAWMVDTNQPYTKEAGICKLFGSEVAARAINRAVQVHGALGYTRDFWIERAWRDARIAEIFEGTNEIQRIVIAEQMLRPYGVRVRP
ncbi:MAG: acyl-CoA dehydrogenase family protein [Anaerolineae bacterium]|jgi:alkylation response protein AidB-like acyl-CoA dehydrogenase|nr:acyl-CoA dehydrogenase family protein [Anaerolineae bacterium]